MKPLTKILNLIFRPWPIRAMPVATISTAFIVMVVSAVVVTLSEESGAGLRGQNAPWIFSMYLLYYSLGFGVLRLGAFFQAKVMKIKGLIYVLTGMAFALLALLIRLLITSDATPVYWREPISQVRLFVVMLLLYFVLNISLGISSYRISEEAAVAKAAKAELEVQRGKLIESQEQTRRQIADFLHDRLQSDLVVLGMQINQATLNADAETKKVANTFVDEIERIRQIDVRQASRALAPELDGPSVLPAINNLVKQYESVMAIDVRVNQNASISKDQRLAVYRIVEQALLNAATHALASKVSIQIDSFEKDVFIEVTNNGAPLPEQIVPGSGFAIIDNWVNLYSGSWSLDQRDGHTIFHAELALNQ